MRIILRHIVRLLSALILFWMPAACSTGTDSVPEPPTDNSTVMLVVHTGVIGLTRSGSGNTLAENEMMKTFRIVILHQNGTVEHNIHYSLDVPQQQKSIILKITPNEKKKIFLFANEESVSAVEGTAGVNRTLTDFFNSYTENMSGFANAANNLYFAPDYSDGKPIPMSSMYEIEVPAQGNVEKTFYVARVATKFTMNFMNWRGEKVTVNSFTIAHHADKNFLMAHVNDSEQNTQLFGEGRTWIDWLKKVSDASSENDDYATTEAAGWLKDYQLPTQANKARTYTHGTVTIGLPTVDIDYPDNSKPGVAENVPVFYLPESMNLKEGATDGEQEYILTLNINGRTEPFVFPLPNLKSLFRNTHVMVNITLYNSMEIIVDVIPYSEVILKPEFGL